MKYLAQKQFQKMLLAAREGIKRKKEGIDQINVFPVPDQDTGTNLLRTLEGIAQKIEQQEFEDFEQFSQQVVEGALNSAQGNAGLIYTGFLAGFFNELSSQNPVSAQGFTKAMRKGADQARASIQNPKSGTILDVIDATASSLEKEVEREQNITKLLEIATKEADQALQNTTQKLEPLREANVVDAGGLGFLTILKSHREALSDSQFEVVALIGQPDRVEQLKEKLSGLGSCLEVVQVKNKLKVHIHTGSPEKVKDLIKKSGEIKSLEVEQL